MTELAHRHSFVPIDGTIFAASAAQPDTFVCLEDGEQYVEAPACECLACSDMRRDLAGYKPNQACFTGMGPSQGACLDPWAVGCTCDRPSGDGECEGCWLWMK